MIYAFFFFRRGELDHWSFEIVDIKNINIVASIQIRVKRYTANEIDVPKKINELNFPLRETKFLNEREPLFYADDYRRDIINILHKIKNQSEIQMQMSKLHRTSGRHGRKHVWNNVPRERKFVDGRFVEIIDIHRETKVRIDGLYETFTDHYWNITGDKSLSKPCIEITRFKVLDTISAKGLMWNQSRLPRKQVSTRSANLTGMNDPACRKTFRVK